MQNDYRPPSDSPVRSTECYATPHYGTWKDGDGNWTIECLGCGQKIEHSTIQERRDFRQAHAKCFKSHNEKGQR